MLGRIFSHRRAAPPQLLRYYSIVDLAKTSALPQIFTESKPAFESHLEYCCDILEKDSIRQDLFSAVEEDLGAKITNLKTRLYT